MNHLGYGTDVQVGRHFTLADLTRTSLPYANVPDDGSLQNLMEWGPILDLIYEKIGPFVVASGYRSPENQAALKSGAQGSASSAMAAQTSYHSQGIALDITPTKMNVDAFFTKILATPEVRDMLGQIVNKSEGGQSSLHISLQTPKFETGTPMYVGSDGKYYRMSADEITAWLQQNQKKVAFFGIIAVSLGVFTLVRFQQLRAQGVHKPTASQLFMVNELKAALAKARAGAQSMVTA